MVKSIKYVFDILTIVSKCTHDLFVGKVTCLVILNISKFIDISKHERSDLMLLPVNDIYIHVLSPYCICTYTFIGVDISKLLNEFNLLIYNYTKGCI